MPLPRRSLPLGAEYVEPQTLKFIPRITTGLSAFTGRASRISLVPAYVGIACNVLAIVPALVAILERRLDETISARLQMGAGIILALGLALSAKALYDNEGQEGQRRVGRNLLAVIMVSPAVSVAFIVAAAFVA